MHNMIYKVFLCLFGLTLCSLLIYIFYKTPNIVIPWSNRNIRSLSTSSSSSRLLYSKSLSNKTRRFALLAASIHSTLRSYIFYTPVAAAAWQRIGYEVIVVFVGDFTNYSRDPSLSQLKLSRTFLQRLGVQIINFQCDKSYSVKISQLVRIFGGFLPDIYVRDKDIIITTDSDIIPIREQDYQLQKNKDGFIYNALCCGIFKRQRKTHQMYPLSHICLRKKLWRDIFLESVQRKELLSKRWFPPKSLSDKAPFSFDTVSVYARKEFGGLYDSNMIKGDGAWHMDQLYSSILLNDYCEKHPKIKIDKRPKTSLRLDPDVPYHMWIPEKLKLYGDVHLIHDEIFYSNRSKPFKNLLSFLFNSSMTNAFSLYYKQFVLTLRKKQ